MEFFWVICICFCSTRLLPCGVLCSPSSRDEGGSQSLLVPEVEVSESPPIWLLPPDGYSLFPPLFKVLSDHSHQGWEGSTPRPRPDSRALRYMKRLYKIFATKEGIPKANKNHLSNTVRLFTPSAECQHPVKGQVRGMAREDWQEKDGDLSSVDLLFNLDCVTELEHLLKSVLLYSFDKSVSVSSSIMCTCHLVVKEHNASNQVCPNVPHAMTFSLHFELRRKWVEIDVTSFLQPLIASNKKSIHMAVNLSCLKDDQPPNLKQDSFNLALVSPSLLLYLNDTSEQAYHRWNFLKRRTKDPMEPERKRGAFTGAPEGAGKDTKGSQRTSRHRRDEVRQAPVPVYNLSQYYEQFLFPSNECELHNFWLRFSQLKWNKWIIAPHRYNPHYCKGDCPRVVGHRYGSPVHTMVQNIIYEKLDASVPRPSCIPAEYSPLSVLKVEPDRSIVYKEYEDMIATKCTCR